ASKGWVAGTSPAMTEQLGSATQVGSAALSCVTGCGGNRRLALAETELFLALDALGQLVALRARIGVVIGRLLGLTAGLDAREHHLAPAMRTARRVDGDFRLGHEGAPGQGETAAGPGGVTARTICTPRSRTIRYNVHPTAPKGES